jgi:hypothetical protein
VLSAPSVTIVPLKYRSRAVAPAAVLMASPTAKILPRVIVRSTPAFSALTFCDVYSTVAAFCADAVVATNNKKIEINFFMMFLIVVFTKTFKYDFVSDSKILSYSYKNQYRLIYLNT